MAEAEGEGKEQSGLGRVSEQVGKHLIFEIQIISVLVSDGSVLSDY